MLVIHPAAGRRSTKIGAETHACAAAETTPYLTIQSPEKQSWKSRLLEILARIVARPWLICRAPRAAQPLHSCPLSRGGRKRNACRIDRGAC